MVSKSRRKGAVAERELVNILKSAGFHAERRAEMQSNADADDPDVYSRQFGRIEVKRRANVWKLLYDALDDHDLVLLRADKKIGWSCSLGVSLS